MLGPAGPTAVRTTSTAIAILALAICTGVLTPKATTAAGDRADPDRARTTARDHRNSRRWSLIAFGCGAWALMGFAQERPQQFSFVLFPVVGLLMSRLLQPGWAAGLSTRKFTSLLVAVIGVGLVWTRCHQGWLLAAPLLALTLIAVPGGLPRRAAIGGAIAVVVLFSPHGAGGFVRGLRMSQAATGIAEWQPTNFLTLPALASVLLVVALLARSRTEFEHQRATAIRPAPFLEWIRWEAGGPRWRKWLMLSLLGALAASAGRHLAASVLIAAPLLAHAWSVPGPHRAGDGSVVDPWPPPAAKFLVSVTGLAVGLAAAFTIGLGDVTADPFNDRGAMAGRLACDRTGTRLSPTWRSVGAAGAPVIATTYNDAGTALWGARHGRCHEAARARVAIDGRADRYGADTISSWSAITNAHGDWRGELNRLGVTSALLPDDSPLVGPMQANGWRIVEHGSRRVSLVRVGGGASTGSSTGRRGADVAGP